MTYTFDAHLSPPPSDVHIHSIWFLDYNDWGKTCIATSAPYWRSRKSRCFLIPWSPSSTQRWMHWTIVSGRDHSGRLVFVGDVWFSESVQECSWFRNVSPFLQECRRRWSQYSHRQVARSNWSTVSQRSRWWFSCTVCCASSLSGFPELSWFWTCCSSLDTGLPGLSEELGSFCNTPTTTSWATGFPELSRLVLGDWVSLEEPRTGWCSTEKPKSSSLFVQSRSFLKEIFFGRRGDKYCL